MKRVLWGRCTPVFTLILLRIVALLCTVIFLLPAPGGAVAASTGRSSIDPETSPSPTLSPRDLVRRSMEEGPFVSYEGTQVVVYWFAGGSTACLTRIIHSKPNFTRIEYLPSAGQSYRLVVSDGRFTWRYEPSLRVVFRSPCTSKQDKEGEDFNLLERNYKFAFLGMDYVAGRQTYVIGIIPRREGNPAKKIWIDSQYPLILRSEDYNSDGALYVLSYFLRIKLLKNVPGDVFQFRVPKGVKVIPHPGEEDIVPVDRLRERISFNISLPEEMPPGYVLKGGRLTDLDSTIKGVHLLYTDGLNTISFFERPVPPATGHGTQGKTRMIPGASREIEINGRPAQLSNRNDAKVLHWEAMGYSFALIGDVSEETLIKIAESVDVPGPQREGNGSRGDEQKIFEGPVWRFLMGIFIFKE
ncbi:MAG TPA: DUF4367 domain-containing protein [Firmicutes bacterium]|nr:DUF4367 domain-containing protein [Bacillota bacterium]